MVADVGDICHALFRLRLHAISFDGPDASEREFSQAMLRATARHFLLTSIYFPRIERRDI